MSFEPLCACPVSSLTSREQEELAKRELYTHNRVLEKRETVVTNVYASFLTNMFQNKSTPYAKRFE